MRLTQFQTPTTRFNDSDRQAAVCLPTCVVGLFLSLNKTGGKQMEEMLDALREDMELQRLEEILHGDLTMIEADDVILRIVEEETL